MLGALYGSLYHTTFVPFAVFAAAYCAGICWLHRRGTMTDGLFVFFSAALGEFLLWGYRTLSAYLRGTLHSIYPSLWSNGIPNMLVSAAESMLLFAVLTGISRLIERIRENKESNEI